MFGLGPLELFIILAIVVVLFGASRLPQIGKGLGEGIKNFRVATRTPPEIDVTPEAGSESSPARPSAAPSTEPQKSASQSQE